jgi:hypothetical protein
MGSWLESVMHGKQAAGDLKWLSNGMVARARFHPLPEGQCSRLDSCMQVCCSRGGSAGP